MKAFNGLMNLLAGGIVAALIYVIVVSLCEPRRYTTEIEYCNGKKDTLVYVARFNPTIATYKEAVPVMYKSIFWGRTINVCSCRVLKREQINY